MSKGHRLLDLALLLLLFTEVQLICFPDSSVGKESACSAGDPGLVPGSGRSAGEGIGYPLQYSGLKNSMDCTSLLHQVPPPSGSPQSPTPKGLDSTFCKVPLETQPLGLALTAPCKEH